MAEAACLLFGGGVFGGMESLSAQKLERRLAKVENSRRLIQLLAILQLCAGPPYSVWTLLLSSNSHHSVLAAGYSGLGVLWCLVGLVGLYACTRKRVQLLVVFTSLEVFCAMLTSSATAALLLLNHLHCWEAVPTDHPTWQPWLQCSRVVYMLGATGVMVVFLSGTASVALSLRMRIQKTGKRNLNWNQKPQRSKERHLRRGGSAALRAMAHNRDERADEDTRIKCVMKHIAIIGSCLLYRTSHLRAHNTCTTSRAHCTNVTMLPCLPRPDLAREVLDVDDTTAVRHRYLAAHDKRYVQRSLLLRFRTCDDAGQYRRLLLHLRKGYFKHGEIFGTKIYLSQVSELVLGQSIDGPTQPTAADLEAAASTGKARDHGCLTKLLRCVEAILSSCSRQESEVEDGAKLYTCTVHARTTSGFKHLFGLTSRSQSLVLQFRSPDERARFLSFVQALLPPTIRIAHATPSEPGSPGGPGCAAIEGQAAIDSPPIISSSSSSDESATAHVAASPELPPLDLGLPPLVSRTQATGSHGHVAQWRQPSPGAARPVYVPGDVEPLRPIRSELITLFVGTWNMGDAVPPASLDGWIPRDVHDLYAIATQECTDEHWLAALDVHLGMNYVRIAERRMGGIFLVVFTHRRHAAKITHVETSFLPTGVLGVGTNKGAVALAFCLRGVRLCIVNAHLAAHADKLLQRNRHVQDITRHLRLGVSALELPIQFHTIWAGDLNYRVDAARADVLKLIEAEQWHTLYELDQLSRELALHHVLFGFSEGRLAFPPTYKYVRQAAAVVRRRGFGLTKGLRSKPSFPRMQPKDKEGKGETPSVKGSPMYESPVVGGRTPPDGSPEGLRKRQYDEEKLRVPSWCDRVLWRSLPGASPLVATHTSDCDDPHFFASDHAPITTIFDLEVPVLPEDLSLHHCTIYLSNLHLYRASPAPLRAGGAEAVAAATFGGPSLTARSSVGKGVPLPVAGNKLQNLPPQLTAYAHLLVLHKLMAEPPPFAAPLSTDGKGATNIVIGPMLVQREFLKQQQLQLRVMSMSGGKPIEIGQAVFALSAAADGRPMDFDVTVELLTTPAGFNLKGTVSIIYTKTLGADAWMDTSRPSGINHALPRTSSSQSCARRQASNLRTPASRMGKASTIDEERGVQAAEAA